MNIWIINHYAIPPSLGGLSRHYYFAKYWMQNGSHVKIFTSAKIHNSDINIIKNNSLYKEEFFDGVEYTFIKSSDYKKNGLKRILNIFEFPHNMKKTIKNFDKPDVIYTSSPDLFTAYSALKVAKKLGIPCIVEIRDLWPESIVEYNNLSQKNPIIKILYQMEKWIYKNADKLIFTIEGGKDYIKDKGWENVVDLNKVYHINNGVDLEMFDKNSQNNTLVDKDLDDDGTFKIVYTGSIRKANNIGFLLDVAKQLQKAEPNIKFLIYGNGNEAEMLAQRLKNEKINNLKLKGFIDIKYIPYIMSKCHLSILQYPNHDIWKYGGSQNKLFTYLAGGKPVLANIKMGYDIIEKYNAGISLSEQTVDSVCSAVLRIKKISSEEYDNYCRNARKAAENYDYTILSQKLISIIEETI